MLAPSAYHEALERDAGAFIEVVRTADPAAPVPACPDWTLTDLAGHLGSVHRWARAAIDIGRPSDPPGPPSGHDALVDWLTDGAAALVETLRTTDPDAPTWTFGPPPHRVGFWGRRQAHETAIHLVDAQQAAGRSLTMDPVLAADGVDEVATMFFPRQVDLGRIPPLTGGLRLTLAEHPGSSFVIAGNGTDPDAPTSATVTAPASDLVLLVWGRRRLDGLPVDGDRAAAAAVLAAGITP